MNKKIALLVLLIAVTAFVCRSEDDEEAEKDASWTDWAKDKLSGAFNKENSNAAAQDSANKASNVASASGDYANEKEMEIEDAAADAAKELSNEN